MLVEWGTVVAILVPVAGLVSGAFRVLDGRLTRIDHRAEEERYKEFDHRAEERYKEFDHRAEERHREFDRLAEERHANLVTLIRSYHPSVPAHSDPGLAP